MLLVLDPQRRVPSHAKRCRYKHEMPVDQETLQKCGFCEKPGWFMDSRIFVESLQKMRELAFGRLTAKSSDGLHRGQICKSQDSMFMFAPCSYSSVDSSFSESFRRCFARLPLPIYKYSYFRSRDGNDVAESTTGLSKERDCRRGICRRRTRKYKRRL